MGCLYLGWPARLRTSTKSSSICQKWLCIELSTGRLGQVSWFAARQELNEKCEHTAVDTIRGTSINTACRQVDQSWLTRATVHWNAKLLQLWFSFIFGLCGIPFDSKSFVVARSTSTAKQRHISPLATQTNKHITCELCQHQTTRSLPHGSWYLICSINTCQVLQFNVTNSTKDLSLFLFPLSLKDACFDWQIHQRWYHPLVFAFTTLLKSA